MAADWAVGWAEHLVALMAVQKAAQMVVQKADWWESQLVGSTE